MIPALRTILTALLLATASSLAATAWAWAPVGTELLVTDTGARSLAGYGVVEADRLRLQVAVDRASLRVLVVVPGASPRTVTAEIADGRVWVFERGGWRDLAALLGEDGLALVLEFADGRTLTVAPDPSSRPPGAAAPAATTAAGATPGAGGVDDDDARDDDDEDDARDDDDDDDDDDDADDEDDDDADDDEWDDDDDVEDDDDA